MAEPPPERAGDDPAGLASAEGVDVIVIALRALLRAGSRAEAASVLQAAVRRLGGVVVPARDPQPADLALDVSLGVGEQLAVRPPGDEAEARFLATHLVSVVEDARWAALRSDRYRREATRATTDSLTRVASRAAIGPRLSLSSAGDAVSLLDLDHFKALNDARGHQAGDAALQAFGAMLLSHVRDVDFVGRYGGDEFLVVLQDTPVDAAYARLRLLQDRWRDSGDHGTTVSAGVAAVDARGGVVATRAADSALYRAKRLGRDRVDLVVPDDYVTVRR